MIKLNRHANIKVMHGINDNYQIYSDGRCFSSYQGGTMLKPYKLHSRKSKKFTPHYTYRIQIAPNQGKGYYVSRLVMFYFGQHNYTNIMTMPHVTYIDEDSLNVCIGNLTFTSPKEVMSKVNKKSKPDRLAKIKDTAVNIRDISKYIKDGWHLNQIGEHYEVSGMSIHRFKKRNKIA